jgi:phosphotransferase system  glucose/maltose/N-acetylglucosamine-specific IIC component
VTSGISSTLTVSTTAPTRAALSHAGSGIIYAFFLPLSGLFAVVLPFGSQQNRGKPFAAAALACLLLSGVIFQAACGTGKPPTAGTPAGDYVITVTGTDSSGTLVSSVPIPPITVQ